MSVEHRMHKYKRESNLHDYRRQDFEYLELKIFNRLCCEAEINKTDN